MGLFLCDICDEQLGSQSHVCDPAKIRQYVHKLQNDARLAENKLDDIRNAVFMVLQSLPTLETEQVTIETEWLRKLWKAAECQWYEAKASEVFLIRWLVTHRILCEAFDLFRSKKSETMLQKLIALRTACDHAQEVLGYKDSNLDLTPEDLIK